MEVLTVSEAAEILKLDPKTVERQLRAGRLPGAKVGRVWRISRAALEGYLTGGWSKSAPATAEHES